MAAITAVTLHFDKYLHVAFGIATSGVGVGLFTFPIIVQKLYDTYGWQGCLLITGGVAFHQVASSVTFPTKPILSEITSGKQASEQRIGAFNLWIFKNIEYNLISLSMLFYSLALVVIYAHLSAYAVELGFSPTEGSLLYTSLGICVFLGRCRYLAILHWSKLPPVVLHMFGGFVSSFASALLPSTSGYIALQIYAVVFGLFTSSVGPLVPLIISDILSPAMITSGYGYALVFSGVGQSAGGPFAGRLC